MDIAAKLMAMNRVKNGVLINDFKKGQKKKKQNKQTILTHMWKNTV